MNVKDLNIGIPKEIMYGERRVAVIPETVEKLVKIGAQVLIETGAGEMSFFKDQQYQAAGALIIEDPEEIFALANIILKVKEPQFNQQKNKHEVEMMKQGQYLITFLHPASPANHQMIIDLAEKGVISLTLDGIPRISRAQPMDALTSMSTIAGYKGVLIAANRLAKFMPMIGTAVGMIKPANVVVIGTGVAGLQAIATAKRLGAVTYAADIRLDACEQAKSLGAKIINLDIPAEIAIGEGGYANNLSEQWLLRERESLKGSVAEADILILSALVPGKIAPILITEQMVSSMRPGSVIIDISVDQGGNCEITEAGTVVERYGVSIDGTKNIPGMVPVSSTWMFAQNTYNFVANLIQNNSVELNLDDDIIKSTLVTLDGKIVHSGTLEAMGLN
ncbi:MAG: NAD(P) transhydrogenase subunit alpha [Clostridia bacterium]|nr:NAD(P) transhydrogenase subunit alpha [Clostridia bacterium]